MTSEPVCQEAISPPVSVERTRSQPFSAMAPSAAISAPPCGVKRRQLIRPRKFEEIVYLAARPFDETFQTLSSRKLPLASKAPSGLQASERTASLCAGSFAE